MQFAWYRFTDKNIEWRGAGTSDTDPLLPPIFEWTTDIIGRIVRCWISYASFSLSLSPSPSRSPALLSPPFSLFSFFPPSPSLFLVFFFLFFFFFGVFKLGFSFHLSSSFTNPRFILLLAGIIESFAFIDLFVPHKVHWLPAFIDGVRWILN